MARALLALAALVVGGAAIAAPGSGSAPEDARQLEGTVGPGFTISLTEDGQPVEAVRPGTYWLTVHDLSSMHNFHIIGPDGLDEVVTSVPFVGDATVKILLKHGTVTFQCDPHKAFMNGSFTVAGIDQVSDEEA
jgi:plastocyanin